MAEYWLRRFVRESNRIEGIIREPTSREVAVHRDFLSLGDVDVRDLETFVSTIAGASLRDRFGMNVEVGAHLPPAGGSWIRRRLEELLAEVNAPNYEDPWLIHARYERLHPFMDGNGRSGRVLWAWQRLKQGRPFHEIGFLHAAYYEALGASREDGSNG